MNLIFTIVRDILLWIGQITGLSYTEINIVVYYIVIPYTFFHLLDTILKSQYLRVGFSVVVLMGLLMISDFSAFSDGLFRRSVEFLNRFEIIGWNYFQASVVICVIVPILIYVVLFYQIRKKSKDE